MVAAIVSSISVIIVLIVLSSTIDFHSIVNAGSTKDKNFGILYILVIKLALFSSFGNTNSFFRKNLFSVAFLL